MNLGVVLPGFLLGCAALFIIVYCLRLMLSTVLPKNLPGLSTDLTGFLENRRLARKKRFLLEARAQLEAGVYSAAAPLFQRALYLEPALTEEMINKAHDHHMTMLECLLPLAKSEPTRLENLSVLEELVQTRTAALQAFREARAAQRKARRQRRKSGGALPQWASQEFTKKQNELREKLAVNHQCIQSEFLKLFDHLEQVSYDSNEVTYH